MLLGHNQHLTAKKEKNEPIKVSQKEREESSLVSTIRQHVVRFHFSQIKSLPFDRILVLMAAFSTQILMEKASSCSIYAPAPSRQGQTHSYDAEIPCCELRAVIREKVQVRNSCGEKALGKRRLVSLQKLCVTKTGHSVADASLRKQNQKN